MRETIWFFTANNLVFFQLYINIKNILTKLGTTYQLLKGKKNHVIFETRIFYTLGAGTGYFEFSEVALAQTSHLKLFIL